jgi:hypothetical protein
MGVKLGRVKVIEQHLHLKCTSLPLLRRVACSDALKGPQAK